MRNQDGMVSGIDVLFDDEGNPWGSSQCQECRIDSIAQSWATLSGAADSKRATQALHAAQCELVDEKKQRGTFIVAAL